MSKAGLDSSTCVVIWREIQCSLLFQQKFVNQMPTLNILLQPFKCTLLLSKPFRLKKFLCFFEPLELNI